jgi:hypothetical protein
VEEKIEKMLTDGGAMLARFSKAMEPVKLKWKQHGHLLPKPKDSVNDTPRNPTNVATKSKEEMARLAAKTIAQKLKDAGVPTDLCWRWFTSGECRLPSCFHKHTEQYRGQGGKSDDVHDETVAEADGPVPGTKCLNCKEEPQYREKGKVHPYCGITCAAVAGALGEPKQNAKLSNNAMIQEDDSAWRGSNYMAMAGISHVEMLEQAFSLGFVASKASAADVASVYSKEVSDLLKDMGFLFTD